jgi:hypothetical protein
MRMIHSITSINELYKQLKLTGMFKRIRRELDFHLVERHAVQPLHGLLHPSGHTIKWISIERHMEVIYYGYP